MTWRVPLAPIAHDETEVRAVTEVLDGGWWSMGPETKAFEAEFAVLTGASQAVAVSSGTAAIHCALASLGIGPGDEVIQPAVNFVAAANMTLAVGATPVFADILGLEEPTLDPDDVQRCLSPKTKAVIAMHYGGYLCRMDELAAICRENGLLLVEDAAHAVGGMGADGRAAGTLGDAGCFSFYSNKNVATAEGGMVLCSSEDIADRVRSLRSHGMTTLAWDRFEDSSFSYDVTQHGYNYRIDDLRSAIGRVQLRRLDETRKIRERLVARYREKLASLEGWLVPFEGASGRPSFHLMVAVAPGGDARSRMVDVLGRAGVQTSLHYRSVPSFTAFGRFAAAKGLATSTVFSERAVTLPLSPAMRLDEVDYVCDAMLSAGA